MKTFILAVLFLSGCGGGNSLIDLSDNEQGPTLQEQIATAEADGRLTETELKQIAINCVCVQPEIQECNCLQQTGITIDLLPGLFCPAPHQNVNLLNEFIGCGL